MSDTLTSDFARAGVEGAPAAVSAGTTLNLRVNGESRAFAAPLTCAGLIAALELTGRRVAIERNGEIVPRSRHADTALTDGDQLEIVVAVGGG